MNRNLEDADSKTDVDSINHNANLFSNHTSPSSRNAFFRHYTRTTLSDEAKQSLNTNFDEIQKYDFKNKSTCVTSPGAISSSSTSPEDEFDDVDGECGSGSDIFQKINAMLETTTNEMDDALKLSVDKYHHDNIAGNISQNDNVATSAYTISNQLNDSAFYEMRKDSLDYLDVRRSQQKFDRDNLLSTASSVGGIPHRHISSTCGVLNNVSHNPYNNITDYNRSNGCGGVLYQRSCDEKLNPFLYQRKDHAVLNSSVAHNIGFPRLSNNWSNGDDKENNPFTGNRGEGARLSIDQNWSRGLGGVKTEEYSLAGSISPESDAGYSSTSQNSCVTTANKMLGIEENAKGFNSFNCDDQVFDGSARRRRSRDLHEHTENFSDIMRRLNLSDEGISNDDSSTKKADHDDIDAVFEAQQKAISANNTNFDVNLNKSAINDLAMRILMQRRLDRYENHNSQPTNYASQYDASEGRNGNSIYEPFNNSIPYLDNHFVMQNSLNKGPTNYDNRRLLDQLGYVGSSLDHAAKVHRHGAAIYEASCTWSGQLPSRVLRPNVLSCKVFLGGVPWDITEYALIQTFKPFGPVRIEWPGKEIASVPKGYLYVIFESEKHVKGLLQACTHDYSDGGSWYFKITSRRMRNKEVQVIPWMISDSNFVKSPSQRLDPQKTVFVGALHGMLTAEGLCNIFNDLFGGVIYAGIDTDKYKYPIGSGRVTFNNARSYMRAVSAAFLEIKTAKFTKKVQVDPYLEDAICSLCSLKQGPYFCRDSACFKYFCRSCWESRHARNTPLSHHRPLMRNTKAVSIFSPNTSPHHTNKMNSSQLNAFPAANMVKNGTQQTLSHPSLDRRNSEYAFSSPLSLDAMNQQQIVDYYNSIFESSSRVQGEASKEDSRPTSNGGGSGVYDQYNWKLP